MEKLQLGGNKSLVDPVAKMNVTNRAVFTQIFQNMIDVACENGHFNRHDAT